MIGVFIMEILLINNLKKREKDESFEQSRNDILANALKIKRQNLLENYSKDKIEENQLYFSLDVEINFLLIKSGTLMKEKVNTCMKKQMNLILQEKLST